MGDSVRLFSHVEVVSEEPLKCAHELAALEIGAEHNKLAFQRK
jgi:hypothetical protein